MDGIGSLGIITKGAPQSDVVKFAILQRPPVSGIASVLIHVTRRARVSQDD